jgi:hypothetical protein
MTLNWNTNINDFETIVKISKRASKITPSLPVMCCMMDLEACHNNHCELDLDKLLNFDQSNFLHDITGITNNLDRTTGKLENCFSPRCSA